jgi:hypothetical protein
LKSKEPPVDAKARQSPLFIFIFFLHVLMCSR